MYPLPGGKEEERIAYVCLPDSYFEKKHKRFPVIYMFDGHNVFFDEDDDPVVQLVCWEILNFKAREEQAIQLCNKLNLQYRWVKFYIDNDKDMVASLDATFDEETCGEICLSLVRRMVSIIDDVYPEVAKARWA
jgi:hypothetical protein